MCVGRIFLRFANLREKSTLPKNHSINSRRGKEISESDGVEGKTIPAGVNPICLTLSLHRLMRCSSRSLRFALVPLPIALCTLIWQGMHRHWMLFGSKHNRSISWMLMAELIGRMWWQSIAARTYPSRLHSWHSGSRRSISTRNSFHRREFSSRWYRGSRAITSLCLYAS